MTAQAWQPIDSAPRDGSSFVTANFDTETPEYEIASFDPVYWTNYVEAGEGLYRREQFPVMEFRCDNFHRATHWMPLPDGPSA
jgi:hypothetical protein